MRTSPRANGATVGTAASDLGEVATGMTPADLICRGIQRALTDGGPPRISIGVYGPFSVVCRHFRLATVKRCISGS